MASRHHSRFAVITFVSIGCLAACSARTRPVASEGPPRAPRTADTASPDATGESPEVDPVADLLDNTQRRVIRAETLFRNGIVSGARSEYASALEMLLNATGGTDRLDPRVATEIRYLADRLDEIDAADRAEPALIDDLAVLDLPAPLDAELRERAEEEVESLASDLPIELHDGVLSMLEYFTDGAGRATIEVGLERAGLYRPMIERVLAEVGVPLDLIYLAQAESIFKPEALSSASAKGMWQFIAARGREYGLRQNWWLDERSDPEKSTRAAARHLRDLHDEFGDWYLAMAAYNSGPGRVRQAVGRADSRDFWMLSERGLLPRETRNYVPTILAMAMIGRDPGRYGFDVSPAAALEVERVLVDQATDLRVIAEHLELPLVQIQELNPHLLRWATPPDITDFELILPKGFRRAFEDRVASLAEDQRILFRHHLVTTGETVSHLAERYDVSISAISDANNLSSRHTIRIGQSLVIPISGVTRMTGTDAARASAALLPNAPSSYRIRRGDTLSKIADDYGLAVADIRRWNQMTSDRLITGDTLTLRAPASEAGGSAMVYSVRPGDTLSGIALLYRISVDELRAWNLDTDLSIIRPGDQLRIYSEE